jgi:hypothetical protein
VIPIIILGGVIKDHEDCSLRNWCCIFLLRPNNMRDTTHQEGYRMTIDTARFALHAFLRDNSY